MDIILIHLRSVNHWGETFCLSQIFEEVHLFILLQIPGLKLIPNKIISFIIDDYSILFSITFPTGKYVVFVMLVS